MDSEIEEVHYWTATCRARLPLGAEKKAWTEACLWMTGKFQSRKTAIQALQLHKDDAGHPWMAHDAVSA